MCGQDFVRNGSAASPALEGRTFAAYPIVDHLAAVGAGGRVATVQSQPPPGVDVAELVERLRSAEGQVAQLKGALTSQRLIGVAVGLLAHRFRCSPEQSWRLLVRLSQTSNVKVREVARILVDAHAGRGDAEDAEVLASLASQLPGDGQG